MVFLKKQVLNKSEVIQWRITMNTTLKNKIRIYMVLDNIIINLKGANKNERKIRN